MAKRQDPTQVHCYTNPSFCRQSEYIPEDTSHCSSDGSSDLPPPPQFQVDDLPPPPAIHQPQPQYGQANPAFNPAPEPEPQLVPAEHQPQHHRSVVNLNHTVAQPERYCYIDDDVEPVSHKRYGSMPMGRQPYAYRTNRYEYIQDDTTVQVQLQSHGQQPQLAGVNGSRYEFIEQQQQQLQQRATPATAQQQQQQVLVQRSASSAARTSVRSYRGADAHYTTLGPDGVEAHDGHWNEDDGRGHYAVRKQINTPRGRYTSVPLQDEDTQPPSLPERNALEAASPRAVNNLATQKLHEILTTPRKPRSRSQGDALSPIKSPHQQVIHAPRNAYTPGCSPSSAAGHRAMNSPMHPQALQHQSTPPSRSNGAMLARSGSGVKGPATSTPNKEPPSARRCLPLGEQQQQQQQMLRRHIEDSQVYGVRHQPVGQQQRYEHGPTVVYAPTTEPHKKAFYQGVEGAFIARTAVVPPLSPPTSEANTTLVSGTEKSDRKNAPLILVLVGILTCGLAIYLSWTQGRRYYYDSAIGCGACCALAGACRSMRRTWTGLGLAGLAALSCAGLLLLAAKSPRPGTPLHDVTAGALCGVSLLGAVLALLALLAPRCTFGRHRRVHSWIPRFSP